MKTCSKCRIEKPATPEFYHRDRARGGWYYVCKACRGPQYTKYPNPSKLADRYRPVVSE